MVLWDHSHVENSGKQAVWTYMQNIKKEQLGISRDTDAKEIASKNNSVVGRRKDIWKVE